MIKQFNLFENETREVKLEFVNPPRILIKDGECKEFLTSKGVVMSVMKKTKRVSGVGVKSWFQITYKGEVLEPLTVAGVKNYILTK